MTASSWNEPKATACLVFADGTIVEGVGIGAVGKAGGEVCFNTAMTGYQEILTDPSYAGQIVTFTFPHIGNVGTNDEDLETVNMAQASGVRGCVLRCEITEPANWRASRHFDAWLKSRGIVGIAGVDTRALTARIREEGMVNAIVVNDPEGCFDYAALKAEAAALAPMAGQDLVPLVSAAQRYTWDETPWQIDSGYGRQSEPRYHVVAVDYGVKRNILRLLAGQGARITVLPSTATAEDILALRPDGVFLSNGPGDPAAVTYLPPIIRELLGNVPVFGICLGHQLLSTAIGATTYKLPFGHHGGNHPVRRIETGSVEITSQNHNYAVSEGSLRDVAEITHQNLNDGVVEGIRCLDVPAFSVQYHPEAGPGPHDARYLFEEFDKLMQEGN
jgi:carbamoyl-phosphate synthase small subunit